MSSNEPNIELPVAELDFSFARSAGPGGQNVNKVNSKAILRWPILSSESLPAEVKERFLTRFANRITVDGDLVISSQKYRDQSKNVEDCLEKLRWMIATVAKAPSARKPTKPSRAAKEKRIESKKQLSQKKKQRRQTKDFD